MSRIFVLILITLDVCAAIAYACQKDPVRCVYWLCAGLLSGTTLLMK